MINTYVVCVNIEDKKDKIANRTSFINSRHLTKYVSVRVSAEERRGINSRMHFLTGNVT